VGTKKKFKWREAEMDGTSGDHSDGLMRYFFSFSASSVSLAAAGSRLLN
jgi:hypothetical protein